MVVKIGILIITISLLVNEFYPFLNTFGPRLRRILILSIISLLTIFSIIDIYNDDQNTTDLKLKTEEIYKKAKETNELQDQSHSSIQESRKEIAGVDSILEIVSDTLNGQVSLLNEAVRKSKELFDLEELKLKLERPLISIISNNVRFSDFFKDSTKIGLEIKIRNIGKRKAINPSYNYILVTHKNQSNKNVFFNLYDFKKLDDFSSQEILTINSQFDLSKAEYEDNYGSAFLVVRFQYLDEFDNKFYDENKIIGIKKIGGGNDYFYEIDAKEKSFVKNYLKELNLDIYLEEQRK